jgi:hypothetical protein
MPGNSGLDMSDTFIISNTAAQNFNAQVPYFQLSGFNTSGESALTVGVKKGRKIV